METKFSNFEKYLRTYAGQALLKKHSLDEAGIWEIRGGDANCDMGGSHHMPTLAYVVGSLGEVIRVGVDLPGFWQWYVGGDFQKINVMTIQDMQARAELEKKRQELQKQIAGIDSKLKNV